MHIDYHNIRKNMKRVYYDHKVNYKIMIRNKSAYKKTYKGPYGTGPVVDAGGGGGVGGWFKDWRRKDVTNKV